MAFGISGFWAECGDYLNKSRVNLIFGFSLVTAFLIIGILLLISGHKLHRYAQAFEKLKSIEEENAQIISPLKLSIRRSTKTVLATILSLIVCVCIGWCTRYMYTLMMAKRDFMSQAGLSNEDLKPFLSQCKKIQKTLIDSDEIAALNSLAALQWLSKGDQDHAKSTLLGPIRRFYANYGPVSDKTKKRTDPQLKILRMIDAFASRDDAFKQAISLTNEDTTSPTSKSTTP